MMEYQISKGWRIFSGLLAAALLVGGILLIVHSFNAVLGSKPAFFLMGAILSPVALYLFISSAVTRLTIDEYSITIKRAYSSRSIPLKDIEGYRRGEKDSLYIVPKDGVKSMRIPINLERRSELIEWLEEKYPDLDLIELEKETQQLLDNDRFGLTKEERKTNLARARRVAGIAWFVSAGLFTWVLIYPEPYEFLMIALLAAPLVAIYTTWYFKGLMRLTKTKSSPYPTVVIPALLPTFGILLRAIIGYDLYAFQKPAWTLLLVASVLVTLIVIGACREGLRGEKAKALLYVCIFVVAGAYSYGAIVFTNCFYDRSVPEKFRVQVTGKWISGGKSTSYYLKLSPWGRFEKGKQVTVSKSFYGRMETGDSLSVFLKQGKWNIPWYRVVRW